MTARNAILSCTQIGTWGMSLFGGFYTAIAPPDDSLKFWPGYASMLAALVFIVYANLNTKIRRVVLFIAVAVAVVLPVIYFTQYYARTTNYVSRRVVVGTELTKRAAEYRAKHSGMDDEELLLNFAGKTTDVWTQQSINHSRLILGLTYAIGFGFMCLALLSAQQELKGPPQTAV